MTSDAELCARLRAGEPSAVRELLERDHPVAVFFARVVAGEGVPDTAVAAVADVWERLLAGIAGGTVTGGLRAALLSGVAAALTRADPADPADPAERPTVLGQLGTFTATGDRWEGWWHDEPPAWPPGVVPQAEHVLRALRRLSPEQRTVLVLHDVARLTAAEVVAAGGGTGMGDLDTLLESARDAYLVEVDREVSRS